MGHNKAGARRKERKRRCLKLFHRLKAKKDKAAWREYLFALIHQRFQKIE